MSQAKSIPFYQPFLTLTTATRVTRYVSVVARWLLVSAAAFGITFFSGLYVIDNVLTKVYQSSATLELPPGDLVTPTVPSLTLEPEPLQPEFENTMMSPDFLLAVVKDLGLDKDWAQRLYKTDQDQLPDVDALTHMENSLRIEVKPGTRLVHITASSDVPVEAARIANAMADRYKTMRGDAVTGSSPVRIIQRAEVATEPFRPDRRFDLIALTVIAAVASVTVASFVEIVCLFVRAGERGES